MDQTNNTIGRDVGLRDEGDEQGQLMIAMTKQTTES